MYKQQQRKKQLSLNESPLSQLDLEVRIYWEIWLLLYSFLSIYCLLLEIGYNFRFRNKELSCSFISSQPVWEFICTGTRIGGSGGWQPSPWEGYWIQVVFKIPSNLSHSMVLQFCDKSASLMNLITTEKSALALSGGLGNVQRHAQNRSMIEQLRLEGTLKIIKLTPSYYGLAASTPQLGLPRAQPWPWAPLGMGHPQLWAAVQGPHCLWVKNFSFTSNLNLPFFQFKAILPCAITIRPYKKSLPLLLISSPQVLECCNEVSPDPSSS